jgi:hypothetical protein
VLIAAFEEVEGYDPARHHNQAPPALWLNNRTSARVRQTACRREVPHHRFDATATPVAAFTGHTLNGA